MRHPSNFEKMAGSRSNIPYYNKYMLFLSKKKQTPLHSFHLCMSESLPPAPPETRKRKAPHVNPENSRLQCNAECQKAHLAEKEKAAGIAPPPTSGGSSANWQPSIEVIEDEEVVKEAHCTKAKNPCHIIKDSTNNSELEEDVCEAPSESSETKLSLRTIQDANIKLTALHLLEHLQADWDAPIYAFFEPMPAIKHVNRCHLYVFKHLAKSCKRVGHNACLVNHYLDKQNMHSMGNLRKHAKLCWSEATIKAADGTKDLRLARDVLLKLDSDSLRDESITAMFE